MRSGRPGPERRSRGATLSGLARDLVANIRRPRKKRLVSSPASAVLAGREPLARGEGRLRVARSDGASAIVGCAAATPLQILAPRRRGPSAWAVLASHGGGLVSGDVLSLEVEVEERAVALITTQAETKVYRSPAGLLARQDLHARVREGGALALVPDAVSPFEAARYEQRQRFDLAADASLLLADGVVAGRTARGERWAFDRYRTRNEVRVAGGLVFGDALLREPGAPGELALRLGRFDAFALLLAVGPAFSACARSLLAQADALPVTPGASLLAVASPFEGGALLRCAATGADALAAFVHRAFAPAADTLGDHPFAHRW
jgi:urease accessory protein